MLVDSPRRGQGSARREREPRLWIKASPAHGQPVCRGSSSTLKRQQDRSQGLRTANPCARVSHVSGGSGLAGPMPGSAVCRSGALRLPTQPRGWSDAGGCLRRDSERPPTCPAGEDGPLPPSFRASDSIAAQGRRELSVTVALRPRGPRPGRPRS
jgi:hypothetical protein